MQTASTYAGVLGAPGIVAEGPQAGERFGAKPLDPGKRPPIKSSVAAGQKEYRCKVNEYGITLYRTNPQPVMVGGTMETFPEVLVRIKFEPTMNGYGRYILGSAPDGSEKINISLGKYTQSIGTPEGWSKDITADGLRAAWLELVTSDTPEGRKALHKAGMRRGALWCADNEGLLYAQAQAAKAREALAVPGVKELLGDAFVIESIADMERITAPQAQP